MKNNYNKTLLAYDSFGQFTGIAKCNHRKCGFYFIPDEILEEIQGRLINLDQMRNILNNEGFEKKNSKYVGILGQNNLFFNWFRIGKLNYQAYV